MLEFDGDERGTLALAIPAEAARTLADFLGLGAADGPDEPQQEVVCEPANMIRGQALSALEKSALRLSAPGIVSPADTILSAAPCRRSFDLGTGRPTVAPAIGNRHD